MNKLALLISFCVVLFDQITKALALKFVAGGAIPIFPFFNFVLVWNRGVSFGMFSDHGAYGPLILIILSVVIIGFLIGWLVTIEDKFLSMAVYIIIAGALGNIIDRVRFGAVIDFFDFHIGSWHYPAFNIADSAIVLGIAFILFDSIVLERKRKGICSS